MININLNLELMNVQNVKIENFKKIKNLDQNFEGKSLIICGENGVGKSTVLQAIQIALGSKNIPPIPITKGEDNAYIEVITGEDGKEYTFTAKFATGKKPVIEVTAPDGIRDNRRSIIGNIVGQVSFDVNAFVEQSKTSAGKREQVELFKSYFSDEVIQELNQHQQRIKNHEEERTEIGKHKTANEGFITEAGINPNDFLTYDKKKDTDKMSEELRSANSLNSEIGIVEERSTTRKNRLKVIEDSINDLTSEAQKIESLEGGYNKWCKTNKPVNTSLMSDELEEAQTFNSMCEKVSIFKKKQELVEKLTTEYGETTALIETERQALSDAIKDMGSPIPDLTFDIDQLYYKGNPVDINTLSTSEIMHLGVELRMASNPNVKVLYIERGESLGADRLKEIQKMANDHGYQIIMEEVERGNKELTFKFLTP